MPRTLLALAFCLIAAAAYAEDKNAAYSNWLNLQAILQSQGISAVEANSLVVEQRCTSLMTEDFNTYYRCKFENALLRRDFLSDQSTCNQQYNNQIKALQAQQPVQTNSASGGSVAVTYPTAQNVVTFDQCMQGRGWPNSNDWSSGRATHHYESLVQ